MQRGRMNSGLSRRFGTRLLAFGLALLGVTTPSVAGLVENVVIDHPPHPFGGLASDTLYAGGHMMQRVADDFLLSEPAEIIKINAWGFYAENNPPATETMRVRFYGARPSDGLPDDSNILYEESFLDPPRTATGNLVFADVTADEFFFEFDLSSSAQLEPDTPYWLEVVQVGDIDSRFRWEFSLAELNGLAVINPGVGDWTAVGLMGDAAFQLLVPEPCVLGLILFAGVLVGRRWGRREARF